ncbi:MAG: type VI secretion protein [Novosphingobium sp.]|nr:type VI secretion protein [Novosphingobium sp.]
MGNLALEKFPPLDEDPRQSFDADVLDAAASNGFPVVAGSARGKDRAGLLLGAAIAVALGALTFTGLSGGKQDAVTESEQQVEPGPLPAVEKPAEAEPAAPVSAQPVAIPPVLPAQQAILAKPPQEIAAMKPAVSPVMVYDTSASADGPSERIAPGGDGAAKANPAAGLSENEAFGSRVSGIGVDMASATPMADPANTVTQGTMIPAILETAIDTDMPGYVRAVVSADVRSFDGSRVLVPRSSRLIGQYKSGLQAGQTRAYVIWTRLIRPDGASVALASPAVEYSGESGLSGEVNSHFFKRFGAAGLLSVIGGLGALASGGASILIASSSSSAASVAAQDGGKIPPTVRVPQGQPVRVFTARDLDFSTVAQ